MNCYRKRSTLFARILACFLMLQVSHLCAQNPGLGKITGRILDAANSEGLFGAVAFIKNTTTGTTADFDGKFSISMAPGTYSLEVKMLGYQTKILKKIVVEANKVVPLTIFLRDQTIDTKAVEIVANVSQNNEDALLKEQKGSNSINSGVSAELLSKTPDRNLSESFRRISGTSIREGKYAMVRGLSERYNMGQLNGVSVPSTESDRKAFSLELFPSNLIDKIVVSKTATPDQPGDMAGGLIKIQTLDIPFSNSFQASLAAEHHSLTTGKDFDVIKKSSTDWLGFDQGLRQIPKGALSTQDFQTNLNLERQASQSRAFNNDVSYDRKKAGPNLSGQISVGRRGKVFGKTAGLVASINYYQTQVRNQFFSYSPNFDKDFKIKESSGTVQDRYRINSSVSGILNLSIKPSASWKLSLRNFFSQTGTNSSQFTQTSILNQSDPLITEYTDRRVRVGFYEQNSLLSHQLSVEKYYGTKGTKLEFIYGVNYLYRSTPDYSRLIYDRSGSYSQGMPKAESYQAVFGGAIVSFAQDISGKFYSEMNELSTSPVLNFTKPFSILKVKNQLKAGGLYQERTRDFTGRNFLYSQGSEAGAIRKLGPDSIFALENFGPSKLTLLETTQKSDFYSAEARLSAGYLMNETFLDKKGSRIIYGIRYESYFQSIKSAQLGKGDYIKNESTVADFLPSVNVNLNLSDKISVRGAYSKTVNRPEFRELAGFTFFEPSQNIYFYGNLKLTRAKISNYDLKFEYYPVNNALISINGFYKDFINPIEVTRGFQTSLPVFTYSNRDKAKSYGFELEGRYRLSGIDSLLKTTFFSRLILFGNFSLIRSEVLYAQTNFKRPIHGQSPYVVNAGIQYNQPNIGLDFLITYNRIGPRVAFLDDQNFGALIWEKSRDIVDLSIGKNFGKFNYKLVFGDLFQQDLIQYIVFDRGGRKKDNTGLFGWISNVPKYQKGQDVPYFRFTNGRTIRFAVTWKISS